MSPEARVTIDYIGAQGDGVAMWQDAPLYVPFSVPGDELAIDIQGKTGRIIDILHPGPWRISPPCPHFGFCGGCALQHVDANAYASWKRNLVIASLRSRGFEEVAVGEAVLSPPRSRRRAGFHAVKLRSGQVSIGFHAPASHHIVDIEGCEIITPGLLALLPALRDLLADLLRAGRKASLHLTESDSGIDMLLDTGAAPGLEARVKIANFLRGNGIARLSWGPDHDLIAAERIPVIRFGGVPVELPPGAFLQATAQGEAALVAAVTKAATGARKVADLFCGLGTFTFPLANFAKVHAADGDRASIQALKSAAARAPGLRQITAERRDLYRRPFLASELKDFDAVVFDPPRAGAQEQARELAKSGVPLLVAVSCNPGTFARDARILADGGYRLDEITPVDQFLWSAHVELVAVFRKI